MSRPAGWLWAPLIAVQFLTRIPITFVPDRAYDEGGGRRRSLVFFPAVGLVVGAGGALVWAGAHRLGLPPLAAAALAAAATAAVTGAFHEDGLADAADALGPHDRARALEAMRDSRIGAFGAVALWTLLTLKAASLAALPPGAVWRALLCAHVLARWSPLPLSLLLPDARAGQGLGGGLGRVVSGPLLSAASALAALCLCLAGGVRAALGASALAVVLTALTGLFYRARFGGVTGDCLGATNQIVECATLLAFTLPVFR